MSLGLLAAHQPDLLPYSGFWAKMWKADVFDLAVFDQVQLPGYQQRVKMRGQWCSLPVAKDQRGKAIIDVRIDAAEWSSVLLDTARGRYAGARFWRERSRLLYDAVAAAEMLSGGWLWQYNLALILWARGVLDIRTPVAIGSMPVGEDATERLIDLCRQYRCREYLSGVGAVKYLDESRFRQAVGLQWSAHIPPSEDSILTLLFDRHDPMQAVMNGGI